MKRNDLFLIAGSRNLVRVDVLWSTVFFHPSAKYELLCTGQELG